MKVVKKFCDGDRKWNLEIIQNTKILRVQRKKRKKMLDAAAITPV